MPKPQNSSKSSYCLAGEHIVHEIIDDEVILMNLTLGHYYSLKHSAKDIFCFLQNGISAEQIVLKMGNLYSAQPEEIDVGVNSFISQLASEEIILPANESADVVPGDEGDEPQPIAATRKSFSKPMLEKFTDLERLLCVDPLHDVNVTGWPHGIERKE